MKNNRFALIRYNARDAFVLVAPPFNNGEWLEKRDGQTTGRTHTTDEVEAALGKFHIITEE